MAMSGGTAVCVKTTYPNDRSDFPVRLYVYYKTSQNVNNNTSTITCGMYITTPGSDYPIGDWTDWNGSYLGTTSMSFNGDMPYFGGTYWLVENKSFTVNHNSDGTGSATIYWKWGVWSDWGRYTNPSGSFTITLPTIPRASSITSASNITLGNACNIKWTPNSSSFKYTLKFSIGSWSYTTGYITPNTTSAYTYTGYTIHGTTSANNTTIYAQLPNSVSGTMTATLTTYNSSNQSIGTATKQFTVTIPDSVKPSAGTITITPQSYSYFIANKNTVKVSVSGSSAGSGSSISSYKFSGPGLSTTTTSSYATSSTISSTGTQTYSVTVTDTRGRSATTSGTITCYAYSSPKIGSFSVYRTNSSGTKTEDGTYLQCSVSSISFTQIGSSNDVTVVLYYKKASATSWSSQTILSNTTSTSGSKLVNIGNGTDTYNAYAVVSDNYGGSNQTSTSTISGPKRIIHVNKDGNGVAFGKMSTSSNLLESDWPLNVNGVLNVTNGGLNVHGDIAVGSSTQDSAPTSGLKIHDIRNVDIKPESFGEYSANLFFHTLPEGYWYSGLHMQGWHDGYAAWELVGNAHNESRDNTLKYRQGINGAWGDWQTVLTNKNYASYSPQLPTVLYSNSSGGNAGTVTLSSSSANFSYLEVYCCDNNGRGDNCARVYNPNGRRLDLMIFEGSDNYNYVTFAKKTKYTISGTTITPDVNLSGYVKFKDRSITVSGTTLYGFIDTADDDDNEHKSGTNYLRIVRVLGYK